MPSILINKKCVGCNAFIKLISEWENQKNDLKKEIEAALETGVSTQVWYSLINRKISILRDELDLNIEEIKRILAVIKSLDLKFLKL